MVDPIVTFFAEVTGRITTLRIKRPRLQMTGHGVIADPLRTGNQLSARGANRKITDQKSPFQIPATFKMNLGLRSLTDPVTKQPFQLTQLIVVRYGLLAFNLSQTGHQPSCTLFDTNQAAAAMRRLVGFGPLKLCRPVRFDHTWSNGPNSIKLNTDDGLGIGFEECGELFFDRLASVKRGFTIVDIFPFGGEMRSKRRRVVVGIRFDYCFAQRSNRRFIGGSFGGR
jgi:hypothetical protein